jgi:predicted secreted protein
MNKQNKYLITSAALLIVAAAFTRLLPHAPNFTAIGAVALFGGSVIKDKKLAFLLPLAALLLSDVCLQLFTTTKGFYGTGQFFVYAAFLIITALATFVQKRSVLNITLAAVWSGVIFFAISNFGTWLAGDFYPKTLAGLGACYWAAIPFYKNELFGNFLLNSVMSTAFYSALLFGTYYLVERKTALHKALA